MAGGTLDPKLVVDQLDIRTGMRIADFGAGSGHFTILFAQKAGENGKVSAIDIQEPPLEMIRAKAKDAGLSNIDIIRADLEVAGGCGLPDASQDLVFAANIFFQSQKKQEIIREAKRILKSGGLLAILEWEKNKGGLGPDDEHRMDTGTMRELVQSEGFVFDRQVAASAFHYALVFKK